MLNQPSAFLLDQNLLWTKSVLCVWLAEVHQLAKGGDAPNTLYD
jgi:hypothetical protein